MLSLLRFLCEVVDQHICVHVCASINAQDICAKSSSGEDGKAMEVETDHGDKERAGVNVMHVCGCMHTCMHKCMYMHWYTYMCMCMWLHV